SSSSSSLFSYSSSSLLNRSQIVAHILLHTNLPIDIARVIHSYLSLCYIFSNFNNNKWYKINMKDKQWTSFRALKEYTIYYTLSTISDGSFIAIEDITVGSFHTGYQAR